MEPLEVFLRITQAIGVVDAQPVEHPGVRPTEHQGMGVGEDAFVFGSQADQGINVEKPAVAEIATGRAPKGQAIVLTLKQEVEGLGVGVDLGHHRIDGHGRLRPLRQEPAQMSPQYLFVAMPPLHTDPVCGGGQRQVRMRIGEEGQVVRWAAFGGTCQDHLQGSRADGEDVVVVADGKDAPLPPKTDLPSFQNSAIVVAKHRKQHSIGQSGLGRIPIDVEIRRIATRWTILEHIPPPGVVRPGDGHMVGHDIEYLAEPMSFKGFTEASMGLSSTEFVVHPMRIDHVIAMGAASRCL
jgi:hypothetical protein